MWKAELTASNLIITSIELKTLIFYSARAFVESLPPQRPNAPWIDEAWHLIVTNNEIATPVNQFQNTDPQSNQVTGLP